eukprot:TRINITY_DN49308_c0_g1_i1.p1 TRINITY_DN49308_c0_g1~~TRINITY_DN49308_c0_g1_i1.p1  ORF type:complete len:726 (+),score=142.53 TRINITY_DN49308_c0_g1_i1:126-2303(+)
MQADAQPAQHESQSGPSSRAGSKPGSDSAASLSEVSTTDASPGLTPGKRSRYNGDVELVCVGLMRTGLQTLHEAFQLLGYKGIYDRENIAETYKLWDDVLQNRATPGTFREIFRGNQVAMGMPTFIFWDQLLQEFPNARVILTVRDEAEWWHSIARAKDKMDKELPGAPLRYGSFTRWLERCMAPSYHKFCELLRFSWATSIGANALGCGNLNEAATRASYRKHNALVRETLANQVTETGQPRLLVYDVRQGWAPLCEFLGKPVPPEETKFPRVMDVPYFDSEKHSEKMRKLSSNYSNFLEGLASPSTEFGEQMRRELRSSMIYGLLLLLFLVSLVTGLAWEVLPVKVPVTLIAGAYLIVAHITLSAYLVMHHLLPRVPAIIVLPVTLKIIAVAVCINGLFVPYGMLKEMLVVHDKVASPLLILSTRLMSVACAAGVIYLREGKLTLGGVPVASFVPFSLANEISTWSGYEIMKYVSFPVQTMAKSCKLLPSMVMGRVLNKEHYSAGQYLQAGAAFAAVTTMQLADRIDKSMAGGGSAVDPSEGQSYSDLIMGVSLLILFFVCDSYTAQGQSKLYKQHKLSQYEMMLGGNLVALALTGVTTVAQWGSVSASISTISTNPAALTRVLALGMCGALGQFCIYYAVKAFGALTFTWMMTARQILSVVMSLVWFGHGITPTKVICISVVFAVMSAKQLAAGCRQGRGNSAKKTPRNCLSSPKQGKQKTQ